MPTSPIFNLLSKVPYFSKITDFDLEKIAQAAIPIKYNTNQAVFIEGDSSAGLYIVEKGWFKIIKTSNSGREQVISFLGPGEAFNALSLFADIPNPATAIALEPSVAWLVKKDILLKMLETHPQLVNSVIKTLAGRVQHLVGLIEDLSLRSVESRLARLLLSEAAGATVHRHHWATQSELAARLGTVTDVLSRTLRKLSEEGIIKVSRHQILILNSKELEARAEFD